jgi:prepilin-type N-terminal cleavage/methylation domain-containing protein
MSTKLWFRRATRSASAGFSMIEMLVSMSISVMDLGSAILAMQHALRLNETAMAVSGMNNSLRTGMDLMVRDMLQVGSGLPASHSIQTPSGTGDQHASICRDPPTTAFTNTASDLDMNAVNPIPGGGPLVNGVATDVLTVITADNNFIDSRSSHDEHDDGRGGDRPSTGLAINMATGVVASCPVSCSCWKRARRRCRGDRGGHRQSAYLVCEWRPLNLNQTGAAAGRRGTARHCTA